MSPDAAIIAMAMRSLAWTVDVPALADAIAAEARTWEEVVLAIGVAFREGGNRLGIVGDNGRALCTMQLHHAPRAVLTDARLCVRIGLARLRESAERCPATPLAGYAGAACGGRRAAWFSVDRPRVGARALGRVLPCSLPAALAVQTDEDATASARCESHYRDEVRP